MVRALKGLAAGLAILCFPGTSSAQLLCGDRDRIGQMLRDRFGEAPRAAGLAGEQVIELLVSGTGSWTILITAPDGRSCVVTGGENWIDKPERPAAPPAGKGV